MPFLLTLDEAAASSAALVGGKALRCAELRKSGFSVPDGFVLTIEAMNRDAALAEAGARARTWPAESLFAVRSSATDEDGSARSFAGMHETVLNVHTQEIGQAIRSCWQSGQSPRAQAYRRAFGGSTDSVAMAVLVQQMVPAVVSGVAFTQNPMTGADELVIQAIRGLGEALVSGLATPEEWRVRKSDRQVASRTEAAESLLGEAEIARLAETLTAIERHYGSPQDIEWCWDGTTFWIVQSRPVTAAAPGIDREWARTNVREVMPDLPPPQVRESVISIIKQAEERFFGKLFAPEEELGPIIRHFFGRLYFNVEQFRHTTRVTHQPASQLQNNLGQLGEPRPGDEQAGPIEWKLLWNALPDILRLVWRQLRVATMVREGIERIEREIAPLRGLTPADVSDEEIARYARQWDREAPVGMQPVFALAAVMTFKDMLRAQLRSVDYSFDELALPVLAAGEKSVSAQQAFDLLRVALAARAEEWSRRYFVECDTFDDYRAQLAGTKFIERFDAFLREYGHRGAYESDWSLPSFAEDPQPLLAAIAGHVQAPSAPDPEGLARRQEEEAREAWRKFEQFLSPWQRLAVLPRVRWLLRRIKQMVAWRELYRSTFVRAAQEQRRWHLELARRFLQRGWIDAESDYFMLLIDEVLGAIEGKVDPAALRPIAGRRRAEQEAWSAIEMPNVLRESELPYLLRKKPMASSDMGPFFGLTLSRGEVEGEAVVMHAPQEFGRMKPGAIIVAPATDPGWTPLFTLAAGVIVELGGSLSHAATVAREYGLPALANIRNATEIIHDGDRLRLNATQGTVEILERAPQKKDTEVRVVK
jgi:pyruvate,water dikinase